MRLLVAVVERFLASVLPLLARRVLAAERQADAAERQARAWEFLLQIDAEYQDYLASKDPARADPVDAETEAVSPAERDDRAVRLEMFQAWWYSQHGELLEDERLIEEFERAYGEEPVH